MRDKGNHHDAVDKSSSEQQFHKSYAIIFAVLNFWSCTPSATGSYGRLSGCQAGRRNPGDFQNSL